MNDTEAHLPMQNSDMELQITALQRQVFLLLLALIVVSTTLVFYLYYQAHILGSDLTASRQREVQVIQTYQLHAPAIDDFNKQLVNYALTHPSFQPVLEKYGWSPSAMPPKP
jgi:hypothetical protein